MIDHGSKPTILIVDDEEIALELIQTILTPTYDTHCAMTAAQCLDQFRQHPIDIVLLDVNLPDISGLELCKQLLATSPKLPVVFISALDTDDERMAGFDAGAYDYIVKPVNPTELLAKIAFIIDQKSKTSQLAQQNIELNSAVMNSIMSAGELGLVIQYAIAVLDIFDHSRLASELTSTLKQLSVEDAVAFIESDQQDIFLGSEGDCTPMEVHIVAMLREKGRIVSIDQKIQVNEKRASLLIKQLTNDPMLRGRILDHVPLLLQITSKRAENIDTANQLIERDKLFEIITETADSLRHAESNIRSHICEIVGIADREFDSIIQDINHMMLDEEHETMLIGSLKNAEKKANHSADEALAVCSRFGEIILKLKKLI